MYVADTFVGLLSEWMPGRAELKVMHSPLHPFICSRHTNKLRILQIYAGI